ncbi:MAG: hypothetical protein A3H70_03845 [Candidatus Komeilibacteria bacterium RIFCSPLOWO2_02_FULL_48_11]|uniref:Methyltransferase type 11 domain-containing protein n=1 Tax=Candidatus Komeilibacteria bacterium RIFCSPLOWO2_02_FULL_48_11 TaxID=1798553 RepID=A0A1G2BPU8_9BACT|nr:MAG: hypothetical protein A3H70_03845 [Candidatus Komeilibacteria bacterium RIFCSPLOWO2_02_FULL_48_11]
MTEENEELNKKVTNWWNDNPFTYNPLEQKEIKPDAAFFREVDRKFIKWTPWGQRDSRPLSAVIDYESLVGQRVLDIAIGTGWSTEQFARVGADVSAIDITPKAVELAKTRFTIFGLPATDIRVADAQVLPWPDNTFDYVLAWGCLMHMPNTEQAISEIYRVLKPGGRMAGMMYNKHSLHWWWYIWLSKGILRGRLLRMTKQQLANRYTDGVYQGGNQLTKFYSSRQIRRMFGRFSQCRVSIHDTTTAIDHWPHHCLSLGRFLPAKIRQYLTTVVGQSLWIEAVK